MSIFAWPWGKQRPTRITMNQDVKPDLPPSIYKSIYPDAEGYPIAVRGESYDCHCNNFGAVVAHIPVKDGFCEHLGVKPDEFTVTGWGPLTGAENIEEPVDESQLCTQTPVKYVLPCTRLKDA